MIKYESALSKCYPAKGNPTFGESDWNAIRAMEHSGARVILEAKGDQHIVKVRVPGSRQIRTSSTSGYPINHAYELWLTRGETDGQ